MRLERKLLSNLLCLSVALCAWNASPVFAQGAPSISTVTLQVVPGPGGGENVITPRGMSVPLPGPGVNGNTVQVYIGSQGGYWYVDRNGENVDLTAAVEQFRAMSGQGGAAAQVPQYAAAPAPVQIVNQQTPTSSSGGGSSGLATAAAAGLGAMAGSAMTGAYYNNGYYNHVPYGTPMYYPHGGSPYYVNASGNTVNVAHTYPTTSTTNNTANTVNGGNTNNIHADNFQKQQDWYQKQQKNNPQQFARWQQSAGGENPFVAQGGFANAAAGGEAEGGRFGRREQGGAAGGAAASEGGGRFGGRFNRGGEQPAALQGNEGGGGRFQRLEGGGGRFGGGGGGGGRFGRRGN